MRVLVACKRGNVAQRNKWGHCLCDACVDARRTGWRASNKKRAQAQREWKRANPEKQREYSAKWVSENKEKRRAIEASWRARNPDRVKAHNAKAGRKWSANNKGKRLASVRARQLAKRMRTPKWADLAAIAVIYEVCADTTAKTGIPHEVDHIIPLQGELVSGLHVPWNLQIIPMVENRRKGTRLDA